MSFQDGTWRCSYGALHAKNEHCRCGGAYLPIPGPDPADLPAVRAGTTLRYSVDEAFRLHLEARLDHPAETVVRRPDFVKEYAL